MCVLLGQGVMHKVDVVEQNKICLSLLIRLFSRILKGTLFTWIGRYWAEFFLEIRETQGVQVVLPQDASQDPLDLVSVCLVIAVQLNSLI